MDEFEALLSRCLFKDLFIEVLGWDHAPGQTSVESDGKVFRLESVAQKRGFRVWHCETDRLSIIDRGLLRRVQRRVKRYSEEHILIYSSDGPSRQVWQWSIRLPGGRKMRHREQPFFSEAPPPKLIDRLTGLRFRIEEEEDLTLVDALERVREALDTRPALNLFVKWPSYARRSAELADAMKSGGPEEFERFVLFHRPLVHWFAKRFHRRFRLDIDDAEQIGMLGLLHAAKRFDPSKGFQFSTYAVRCIEGYCRKFGPEFAHAIRIPVHLYWPCLMARKKIRPAASGGPSAVQTILERLEEQSPKLAKRLPHIERAMACKSLSDRKKPEYQAARTLVDPGRGPFEIAVRRERIQSVRDGLEKLRPRESQILRYRYGIDCSPLTLREIGRLLGLTRERVRQIQKKAEKRLRLRISRSSIDLRDLGPIEIPPIRKPKTKRTIEHARTAAVVE